MLLAEVWAHYGYCKRSCTASTLGGGDEGGARAGYTRARLERLRAVMAEMGAGGKGEL